MLFALTIKKETPKAILAQFEGKEFWLPLSQVKITTQGVDMPEWLAVKNGLMNKSQMTPRVYVDREIEGHELAGRVIRINRWLVQAMSDEGLDPMHNIKIRKVFCETPKAYKVEMEFFGGVTNACCKCGLKLTHPVSVATGVGPECAKHYGIQRYDMGDASNIIAEMEKRAEKQGVMTRFIPKFSIKEVI